IARSLSIDSPAIQVRFSTPAGQESRLAMVKQPLFSVMVVNIPTQAYQLWLTKEVSRTLIPESSVFHRPDAA
ncbi:hypothetical protein, partial [Candidimonas sp. SYP-B2681]|uniref:hypothetical protein n=1 Tax=Candidimonas sp. SYP-B2681 TaxID=2497686 RepID=UPI001F158F59